MVGNQILCDFTKFLLISKFCVISRNLQAALHFAPLLVGPANASDLLITGRVIKSSEALQMGLGKKNICLRKIATIHTKY